MSCVIEGFYVRFFWDWLAFISGAFRWKVFAVFADDVGETSSLSPHAALLTPCPIAINAALDTVVNIRRGLMNGRQISSMEPLLFPFFSSPVDGSIKLIRPSVIMRTSSTLSRALLNHPTDISSGTSITTVSLLYALLSGFFHPRPDIAVRWVIPDCTVAYPLRIERVVGLS